MATMPTQPKLNATLWVVTRPLLAPFWLEIAATEDGTVIAATFRTDPPPSRPQANAPAAIHQLSHWLDTWLEAPATPLWPRVAPQGTPFQQRVWNALRTIPCGETRTYGALAAHLSTSPRAVGAACGANPCPIVIPCHRVVGRNGALIGFSGGHTGAWLDLKAWLLERENART